MLQQIILPDENQRPYVLDQRSVNNLSSEPNLSAHSSKAPQTIEVDEPPLHYLYDIFVFLH